MLLFSVDGGAKPRTAHHVMYSYPRALVPSCARILMPTNSQLTITTHDLLDVTHDSVVTTAHQIVIDHYDSVAVFILEIRWVPIPLHHCFSVCLALSVPLSW